MPRIVTCEHRRCEQHWNIGSDDFVVPGIVAIVLGFFNLTLVSAVLIVLYYVPSTVLGSHDEFCNVTYSPLLYAPLFSLAAVEVCFILSEGLIVIVSAQGPIYKITKSSKFRTKFMPLLIYLRIIVAVLELLAIIASLVGIFHPSAVSDIIKCEPLRPRLYFAQATVLFQVLCYIFFLLKVCVYTDPLGCATPGLLESVDSTDSNEESTRQKYERKLRTLFCCLGVRGRKSVPLADVARGLYLMFSDIDVVLSDVIAGLSLLRRHQICQKETEGGEIALCKKFRVVTFQMMPPQQCPGCDPGILRKDHPFDFTDVGNQLLFEDLEYYMHYAMGVYGWPLHVFDNLCCGVCQLCSVTCCRFRCLHRRAGEDLMHDNCCMCGIGTFKLRTNIPERDILYVNFKNELGVLPFIVCYDHHMKTVVICVRGTLSLKDTLTDMNYLPVPVNIGGVKETYIHGGMYEAAETILNDIKDKDLLNKAFDQHSEYRLVLTGHSLGAGVASILALLIKQEMKYSDEMMKCYAFSPPGALFSFPLAEYSKSFITSVVLGNDIVPRLTLRSLLHLKYSVQHQLDNTEVPKYQILCKSKTCAECYSKSKEVVKETSLTIRRASRGGAATGEGVAAGEGVATEGGVAIEEELITKESEVSGNAYRGLRSDEGGVPSGRDHSIEWMVFNEDPTLPTTASIRNRLFPHKITRQKSVHFDESTLTRSFISKLELVKTMDEVEIEGHIEGTEVKESNEDTEDTLSQTHATSTPSTSNLHVKIDMNRQDSRRVSDPTPGGSISKAIPDIHKHCRIDESSIFTPFFPPGRLLHLQVQKSNRWCGKDQFNVVEVNRENMCIIFLDSGVIADHLPNNVLSALKKVKVQCMNTCDTYNKQEIQKMREKQAMFKSNSSKFLFPKPVNIPSVTVTSEHELETPV